MTLSTYICLCGFLACLAALAAMKARRICRDVWRSFTGRRGAFAALAAFAVIATICAQKPGPTPVITVDSFLADAGSYATNNVLHVAVTNAPAYAGIDFSSCPVLVYARPRGLSDAPWEELLPRRTFSELPADYAIEDATNYNYLVYLDYVPPSPVHTNGVFELRGFMVPGDEPGNLEQLAAGFINSRAITIRDLPYDAEVEYLESTGTQWIDTGVVANGEFDADYTISTPSSFRNFIVGGARSTTQHLNFGQYEPNGTFIMAYLGSYWTALSTIAPNTTYTARIHYASGSQTATVNGTAARSQSYSGTESLNLNIHPFKRNFYNASDTILPMTGKMHSFKIWQNGTLVRDYIPVRVGTTGAMYDRRGVGGMNPDGTARNDGMYYNRGTGDFQYGLDVVPVEYIESTGTQWIDTGVVPASTSRMVADIKFEGSANMVSGVWGSSGRFQFGIVSGVFTLGIGSIGQNGIAADTLRHTVILDAGTKTANIDGNQYSLTSASISFAQYTIPIFAQRYASNTPSNYCRAKLYGYKPFNNGVLVRDYQPIRVGSGSTWEGALLDNVSRKVYRNAGTGNFGYGNDK